MSDDSRILVVDRVEGSVVVVVDDESDSTTEVDRASLPFAVREGQVLRVPMLDGEPDWSRARVDEALERQRLEEARRVLGELKRRDPGGDIAL